MTELDIERERREFAAWYAPIFRGGEPENMPLRKNGEYVAPQDQIAWMAWLAAKRSMQGSAEPVSLQDAPEKIYLVIEDDNGNEPYRSFEYAQKEANMSYGIMWCTDPQGPNDIPYVRVDLAAPPAPVCAETVKWEGLSQIEKSSFVDDICDYGTGFVTPLFAVIDNIEKLLKERNNSIPATAHPALQKLMSKLADFLDEDKFADCESIMKSIGVAPPSTDAKDSERMFPMQHPCLPIPWKTAEIIYAGYAALYGTNQSMERMAERGGFGWDEVGIIYREPRAGNLMDKLSRAAIAAKEAK